MDNKWKKWIYGILILGIVIGFFYLVLEREEPTEPDNSIEEDVNKDKEDEENRDEEDTEDTEDNEKPDEEPEDDTQEGEVPEGNTPAPDIPQEDTEFSQIEIGEKLPDFTLESLQGEEVNLRELEGKIVLINFWATWCPWCDKEMADLDKLDKENEDLVVIGVNVDETRAEAEKYVKDGGYDFKVVLDEGGKVAGEYLVTGLPASYFVNEDGIYVGRVPSYMTAEQMNEALEITRDF